ncbi:MAG: amino acid permease [Gemmatimonadota bacterium]|nr:MAG: amino acid permease [Gemmatimonadota bacterium]
MASREAVESGRALGIWRSTALVVGNMIGSGVFLLPASLALYGGISLLGWAFATAGAVVLALVFARWARLMPKVGGPYAYTRAGFGDFAGFLVAWGYWISIWCGNAAIATAFAGYLGVFLPPISESPAVAAVTAAAAIWLLIWVNARGVRGAGIVQLATTVLKLLPLVAVGTLGLLYFDAGNLRPFNVSGEPTFAALTATATLTLWAFLGLESATVPANDVRDPERTIPRATIFGTLGGGVVYVLSTIGVMGVMAPAVLSGSTAPFADAASAMWGGWASYAVGAGAAISCFGALNGWILLSGQVPYAAAKDGLLPARFGRLSERGTPVFGLVISGILATVLLSMNYTRGLVGSFTFIILLSTMTSLFPYVMCSAGQFLVSRRAGGRVDGRRLTALLVPALAFLFSLWAIAGSGRDAVYWGFMLLLAGIPLYVWMRRSLQRSSE